MTYLDRLPREAKETICQMLPPPPLLALIDLTGVHPPPPIPTKQVFFFHCPSFKSVGDTFFVGVGGRGAISPSKKDANYKSDGGG